MNKTIKKPRYTLENEVRFNFNGRILIGIIKIIDSQGTFIQQVEPSYDIFVTDDKTLYKHIRESFIEYINIPTN